MGESSDINYEKIEVYSPLVIANELIKISNYSLNLRMLEKIMYFAHGWCLKITSHPLIRSPFYAWEYGPIEMTSYQAFKHYGERPITQLSKDYSGNIFDTDHPETLEFLRKIYETYILVGSISNKLHSTKSAWWKIYSEEGIGNIIPNELIDKMFLA